MLLLLLVTLVDCDDVISGGGIADWTVCLCTVHLVCQTKNCQQQLFVCYHFVVDNHYPIHFGAGTSHSLC